MSLRSSLGAAVAWALLTTPASAEVVAQLRGTLASVPQPLGAEVLWAERANGSDVAIQRAAPGVAPVTVATVASPISGDGPWYLVRSLDLAASPQRIGAGDAAAALTDDGRGNTQYTQAARRVFAGPAAGPLAQIGPTCESLGEAPAVAVSGATLAYVEPCGGGDVVVDDGVTTRRIAAGADPADADVQLAGRYLGVATSERVTVYDATTGAEILRSAPISGLTPATWTGFGLQDDGTIVVAAGRPGGTTDRLAVYAPTHPRAGCWPCAAAIAA